MQINRCFGFISQNIREGNGTPLQYSCLENPVGGGAWWAAVHGVAKSQTWLSDFTFTFHFLALEKEMATHSSVLAWRIPGTEEPGGLPSMGLHRVRHDWSDLAAAADDIWCGASFHVLICRLYSFFSVVSIQVFSPYFNGCSSCEFSYSWVLFLLLLFFSGEAHRLSCFAHMGSCWLLLLLSCFSRVWLCATP